MFRFVFYLLFAVILISVIRGVIKAIGYALRELLNPPAGRPAARPGGNIPLAGELKRDPVCGTFIATSTSLTLSSGPETTYFCSAECRDKFLATAAHR